MTYHSASCVVAGEDVTIEDGKAVSEALLSAFGYQDFRFQPDEKRSKVLHAGLADRGLRKAPGARLGGGGDVWHVLSFGPRRVRHRRPRHEPRAWRRAARDDRVQCRRRAPLSVSPVLPAAYRPGNRTRRTPQEEPVTPEGKGPRARDCAGRGSECHGTGALLL